jgi:serine/threonine protein kinase
VIKKRSTALVRLFIHLFLISLFLLFFQHTSSSIVTDKYELGKKMGDGNFAVVHRSKLRGTEREYAIKIIDKSKMKVIEKKNN